MKKKISKILLLLLFFVGSPVDAHQLKFSTTLIEYEEKSGKINFIFNVFMDDFVLSAKNLLSKEIDYLSPTKADKKRVKKYFDTYFKISINGEKLDIKYEEIEIHTNYNAFSFKFSSDKISIKKGDELVVENNIMFTEFGYRQTNVNVIRMLPFFSEKHYQATYKSSIHKLKIQ